MICSTYNNATKVSAVSGWELGNILCPFKLLYLPCLATPFPSKTIERGRAGGFAAGGEHGEKCGAGSAQQRAGHVVRVGAVRDSHNLPIENRESSQLLELHV